VKKIETGWELAELWGLLPRVLCLTFLEHGIYNKYYGNYNKLFNSMDEINAMSVFGQCHKQLIYTNTVTQMNAYATTTLDDDAKWAVYDLSKLLNALNSTSLYITAVCRWISMSLSQQRPPVVRDVTLRTLSFVFYDATTIGRAFSLTNLTLTGFSRSLSRSPFLHCPLAISRVWISGARPTPIKAATRLQRNGRVSYA